MTKSKALIDSVVSTGGKSKRGVEYSYHLVKSSNTLHHEG